MTDDPITVRAREMLADNIGGTHGQKIRHGLAGEDLVFVECAIDAISTALRQAEDDARRMREALEPFARLAGPINGEEGRPTYIDAIGGNDCGEEIQVSTYVGNGTRIEVLQAEDFRRALATLRNLTDGEDRGR